MNKTFAYVVALSLAATPCAAFAKGSAGGHASSTGHASTAHASSGKSHHVSSHAAGILSSAKATVLGHTPKSGLSHSHTKKA